MRSELQDLSLQEAEAITGGDAWLIYEFGKGLGYVTHAVVDAFLTPPPATAFNWARDK